MKQFSRDKVTAFVVIGVILLVALVYTLFVINQNKREQADNNPANRALQVAADEEPYTDLAGNPLSLNEYVGKVLVVNSWASWSPDSTAELQIFAALRSKYDLDEVVILAINRAEPQTTAERYLRTLEVSDQVQLVLDPTDRYYRSIGGFAMPETIIYDRRGGIVHHQRGPLTAEQATIYIDQALSKQDE